MQSRRAITIDGQATYGAYVWRSQLGVVYYDVFQTRRSDKKMTWWAKSQYIANFEYEVNQLSGRKLSEEWFALLTLSTCCYQQILLLPIKTNLNRWLIVCSNNNSNLMTIAEYGGSLKRLDNFSSWILKIAWEMGKHRTQQWTRLWLICSLILLRNKLILEYKHMDRCNLHPPIEQHVKNTCSKFQINWHWNQTLKNKGPLDIFKVIGHDFAQPTNASISLKGRRVGITRAWTRDFLFRIDHDLHYKTIRGVDTTANFNFRIH